MTTLSSGAGSECFKLVHDRHPGVTLECAEIANYCERLSAAEMGPVISAVQNRKNEFSTGRWLAHKALEKQGRDTSLIGCGSKREPLWPIHTVGSIAHNHKWALAAVAPAEIYSGIGVDIERRARVGSEIVPKLLTEKEQKMYRGIDPTLIFSAKEAVYKLLYPLLERYVDFLEVEITLDIPRNLFVANMLGEGQGRKILNGTTGTFFEVEDDWLTFVSTAHCFV